ncbi:MAG: GNAT family N-acetyltransferase [Erysipelotrichia bacterium]|nr:GNAT family N-acetyltransferase [Erysipelotrichia bacterium]
MTIKLIKLTKDYYDQLVEMIDEWRMDIKQQHTNSSPATIFENCYDDFDYYLAHLEVKQPTDTLVPDSTFFLYDEKRAKLLGAINIRHYLSEYLLHYGGHIGCGIRPSERRKGYATLMIIMALIECKKLGINRVLMVCNKDNIGSVKSILNNGGLLENETVDLKGNTIQRYWINI